MNSPRQKLFREGPLKDLWRPLNTFAGDVAKHLEQIAGRKLLTLAVQTRDPVESVFPMYLAQPTELPIVLGLHVVGVRNLSNPSALFYFQPHVDWQPNGDGRLLIRFVGGLDINSSYALTLEAIGE